MGRVVKLLQDRLPGVFVHSLRIGEDTEQDHKAGFFGQLNDQVIRFSNISKKIDMLNTLLPDKIDYVCDQLAGIPELANGFNAIGFSQVKL